MTAMAHRRPITTHPAFAPLIALWFAALLGLTVAVLPAAVVERALAAIGLGMLTPLTLAGRIVTSSLAAVIGALAGYGLARRFALPAADDPRPLYAEAEPAFEDEVKEAPARRPLHVREELSDGFGDESQVVPAEAAAVEATAEPPGFTDLGQESEGFMILTPQPTHPPRPAPDLETLLEQFDSAFAAFTAGGEASAETSGQRPASDPVRAFVAQQTGVPAPAPPVSPMGGLVPDHQAELRAALDKLARSQRSK